MNVRFYSIFLALLCVSNVVCNEKQSKTAQPGWFPATLESLRQAPFRLKGAFKEGVKKRFPALWTSLHSAEVATVETSSAISKQEKEAVSKRMQHVDRAVRAKLGSIKEAPRIAVVASGGGLRASLATLGALAGLEKAGILNTVTWLSSLSGSAWAVGSWLQYALRTESLAPTQYAQDFAIRISDRYVMSMDRKGASELSSLLLVNAAFDMPITLVDLFGGFLSNVFFSSQNEKLSSQVHLMKDGTYPIPIYTAVSGEPGVPRYWYAYTPWNVAIEPAIRGGNGFSIPTWAFGRKFENKKSEGYKPEKSLGFNLGTFGSAFAADIKTLYKQTRLREVENLFARSIIDSVIGRYGASRFTYAQVYNFTKGMKHSPFGDNEMLQIVDAGTDFNLPYPPVSGIRKGRSPDILIFIDASRSVAEATQLKKVEKYARSKKLKFPRISYKGIAQRAVSVFKNEKDSSVPTLIYIPVIKDVQLLESKKSEFPEFENIESLDFPTCCGTTKGIVHRSGQYTVELAKQVMQLMEFNVRANEDLLWEEIELRAGTPGLYEYARSLYGYGKKKLKQARERLGKFGI